MQSTIKNLSLAISAVALSVMGASPVSANWQASDDGKGATSAEACLSGAPRLCVRLLCIAGRDGNVYWTIDAPEPEYSPETTSVSWTVDGRTVMHLQMRKGWPGNGIQTYEADFDQTRHQSMVDALKSGNLLTVHSDQFVPFSVSLRGSGAALGQTLDTCPLTGSAKNKAIQPATPVESFDLPLDAVKALMAAQDCKATETEIFNAITNGGFGTWDANQFVVGGAEDGTLVLLEKADGIYKYRLGEGCQ